jgi:hypothetical protein
LTTLSFDKIFVVRSPDLLNETLTHQVPIVIKNRSHQTEENGIQIVSIQFDDQLSSVLIHLSRAFEDCQTSIPCDLIFVDVSRFQMCLVSNLTITSIIFKGYNDPLSTTVKVRPKLARNQCHLTIDELKEQKIVDMLIGNATNPVSLNNFF